MSSSQNKNTDGQFVNFTGYESLPHNIEAEQAILGAILIDEQNRCFDEVSTILRKDHFYDPMHGRIFEAAEKMISKDQLATPITLNSYFQNDEGLNQLGGAKYLARLASSAISTHDIKSYAQIIFDLYIRRNLINIGKHITHEASNADTQDISTVDQIEKAERSLYNLAEKGRFEKTYQKFSTSLAEAIDRAARAYQNDASVIGIPTGFKDLDQKLGGLQPSDLIILAGRPSMGKTSLGTNIAFNVAKNSAFEDSDVDSESKKRNNSVAFFSLEMSSEQLATRILSEESRVISSDIRRGRISELDYDKIVSASKDIQDLNIFIDDTPALSINAIRARARRIKRMHSLDLIIVDYLQLVRPTTGYKSFGRVEEVTEVTQGLKALAKELNVPVLALSQLSRAVEQREDKKPQLSDLRESGSIEQDADVVLFIYREEYYLENAQPKLSDVVAHTNWQALMDEIHGVADIIIGKQRHGPTGSLKLAFDRSFTKFGDFIDKTHLPEEL